MPFKNDCFCPAIAQDPVIKNTIVPFSLLFILFSLAISKSTLLQNETLYSQMDYFPCARQCFHHLKGHKINVCENNAENTVNGYYIGFFSGSLALALVFR